MSSLGPQKYALDVRCGTKMRMRNVRVQGETSSSTPLLLRSLEDISTRKKSFQLVAARLFVPSSSLPSSFSRQPPEERQQKRNINLPHRIPCEIFEFDKRRPPAFRLSVGFIKDEKRVSERHGFESERKEARAGREIIGEVPYSSILRWSSIPQSRVIKPWSQEQSHAMLPYTESWWGTHFSPDCPDTGYWL
ncbi:hypothetical protein PROFUN_02686 [Planoprotostelium fungivorum]|uniref:Uncharacterized protein n=1 Tax=Planoprotostelium fungivorum TaxID=1890364 RepID=A0A2P6NVF2_9EUKA|nr:hypothetical protein PROFUN_02686 [Planoprotostelium fungivorum]